MKKYPKTYNPKLLKTIPRDTGRNNIGWKVEQIPFSGFDLWNCYEFSFLKKNGKPFIGILQIEYRAESKFIVESKSLKLYLNSLNMTKFQSPSEVVKTIRKDIQEILETPHVNLKLITPDSFSKQFTDPAAFTCIDTKKPVSDILYNSDPKLLKTEQCSNRKFFLYSNLLKSNCPLTSQPDWGSVYIYYYSKKKKVTGESLMRYIISFRNHDEFHEECCERILYDLMNVIEPKEVIVFCKYTRRGGIDINPFRGFPAQKLKFLDIPQSLNRIIFSRDFRQ